MTFLLKEKVILAALARVLRAVQVLIFFFFLLNSTKELYSRNSRKGFPWALSGFLWKERLSPAPAVAGEAGMAGWSLLPGSVDEPLAGLLPAAGRAPHVPVLHPINLAALLAFASRLP